MPNDYRSACIKNLLASLNLLEITVNRLIEVIQTNQTGGNSVLPKRVTMAYNALGQRTQLARFQSTGSTNPVATTDYTYDTANRLSGIAHKQGTTNLNTYAYTYDPLSRLKTVTSTLDGLTNYTYSQNDQRRILMPSKKDTAILLRMPPALDEVSETQKISRVRS